MRSRDAQIPSKESALMLFYRRIWIDLSSSPELLFQSMHQRNRRRGEETSQVCKMRGDSIYQEDEKENSISGKRVEIEGEKRADVTVMSVVAMERHKT